MAPSKKIVLLISLSLWCLCGLGQGSKDHGTTSDFDEFGFEPDTPESVNAPQRDPLRFYNHAMFRINDRLYFWLLKPAATGYAKVIPEPGRIALGNFFNNIGFPVRLVGAVLQGKFKGAGTECARFGINTTIGLLGFRDPAREKWKLQPCREDFGQTLAVYGCHAGPPLELPLLGPSNLRDFIGMIPDFFLDPVTYIHPWYVSSAVRAGDIVNRLSLHPGEYESLIHDALDPYTAVRNAYKQYRNDLIKE